MFHLKIFRRRSHPSDIIQKFNLLHHDFVLFSFSVVGCSQQLSSSCCCPWLLLGWDDALLDAGTFLMQAAPSTWQKRHSKKRINQVAVRVCVMLRCICQNFESSCLNMEELAGKHTHTHTRRNTNRCPADKLHCLQNLTGKNSRKGERKKNLKHKQQMADADSVIVWIGDRLVEY